MRNGNVLLVVLLWYGKIVLTVPMRNGNRIELPQLEDVVNQFLPYLWGMETISKLRTPVREPWFLPYLWGMETCLTSTQDQTHPRFLPYLWGMETGPWQTDWEAMASSYRTYEEWKHYNDKVKSSVFLGSYRTYEEWKRHNFKRVIVLVVRFLPYLWGMETRSLACQ